MRRDSKYGNTRWWVRPAALAFVVLACSDLPSRPVPIDFIRVLVKSSGDDLDVDGYQVLLDGQIRLPVDDILSASSIATRGEHTVELRNVAPNCTVNGPNPRTVTVESGGTITQFQVVCLATGFSVTTHSTGADVPQKYRLTVDERPPAPVLANGVQTYSRLLPGRHLVTLQVPNNCTVVGGSQITVDVVWQNVASITLEVSCAQVVRSAGILYENTVRVGDDDATYVEMVKFDGTEPVRFERGTAPAWSPDGTKFVFSTAVCSVAYYYYYTTCIGGLVVRDPELGDVRALYEGPGFRPAWSPLGELIAYEFRPLDRDGYVETQRSLILISIVAPGPAPMYVTGPQTIQQPAWSPDGKRIAVMCTWETKPGDSDLCVVNQNGQGLVWLTNDTSNDTDPAWSPDGTRIAFTRYPAGHTDEASAEVVLLDIATGQRTVIASGTDPAWSPDGSKLVFAGLDGLFVVNADGTNRTRLTTGKHHAPAWRP